MGQQVTEGCTDGQSARVLVVDVCDTTREALVGRLRCHGFEVDGASDAASAADTALRAPPDVVVADLWMPSISGAQLCRLLRSEPATAEVPVILRGGVDDPRSRFWAERAGASAYVVKGRMSELMSALRQAIAARSRGDGFFVQLSDGTVDIRDRIARYLDAALFDHVVAAEVRAMAACGSFERLFDLFSQFLSRILSYEWLAIELVGDQRGAIHQNPSAGDRSEQAARSALGSGESVSFLRVEDEDASARPASVPVVRPVSFAKTPLGKLAVGLCSPTDDARALLALVARELGGPLRMTLLVEESQRMASTDPLTGLVNRRSFATEMRREMDQARRQSTALSFLILDLDHFKDINDTRGHSAGDAVLTALGALLRATLRSTDIPARWGGEEFVVALPRATTQGAIQAAERLRRAVEALIVSDDSGASIRVTISIGVATLLPGEAFEVALGRADRALYRAKSAGRNRVVNGEAAEEGPDVPAPDALALCSGEGANRERSTAT